jgi:hypothetical protein
MIRFVPIQIEDLDTLSEWVKSVRSLKQIRILKLSVGL